MGCSLKIQPHEAAELHTFKSNSHIDAFFLLAMFNLNFFFLGSAS